ncbi:hypothetical protein CHS0354_030385 [Potamilus streckersoni]|uniref:Uncharacterized protein n=1 Tax=Potamilus streckersoni TaxID=2493646 RepID=A0AAE0W919_9BIVA|nr:hypothetical protein CHS0354_030385 [Potamilus streckersoni]
MEVTHRAGHKHRKADALSRNPCNACNRQQEGNETYNDETACQNAASPIVLKSCYQNQQKDKMEQIKNNDAGLARWEPNELGVCKERTPISD